MVTSEAMASGCLIVTDKEANQEIIEDEKNGIIIDKNYEKETLRILSIIENKKKAEKIVSNSLKTIKELSLDKWAQRYLKFLMNEE
jgi:glycosyltransferase involved in cell wall biosynthesis